MSKLSTIFAVVIIGLVGVVIFMGDKIGSLNEDVVGYKQQVSDKDETIDLLNGDIRGYQDAEKKSERTIAELRELARNNKGNELCDCYNTPIPSYILERLRNRNSD